jgi:hypothetical protein
VLLDVDVVLDPEHSGSQRDPRLEVPGIELLLLSPLVRLLQGVVEPLERVVLGQELEVVAKLVGDRLPELLLPGEVGVALGQPGEGPVVERKDLQRGNACGLAEVTLCPSCLGEAGSESIERKSIDAQAQRSMAFSLPATNSAASVVTFDFVQSGCQSVDVAASKRRFPDGLDGKKLGSASTYLVRCPGHTRDQCDIFRTSRRT